MSKRTGVHLYSVLLASDKKLQGDRITGIRAFVNLIGILRDSMTSAYVIFGLCLIKYMYILMKIKFNDLMTTTANDIMIGLYYFFKLMQKC